MNSTSRIPGGIPLLSIGYNYNSRKLLGYIATKGYESTEPVDPYLYRFPDIYSNVFVCPVACLRLLGSNIN